MKNKIAIASAFLAASSFSFGEIAITDNLSFEGFVDMSYSHWDADFDGTNESDNSFAIDQVEISWLFDFEKVTAQIDIDSESSNGSNGDDVFDDTDSAGLDEIEIEQAFATYHLDNGGAITAGRYASMLGFEAFEPTGLYQYSFAYTLPNDAISGLGLPGGIEDVLFTAFPLPGYNNGVKYTQESDTTFFGISLQDGIYNYGGRLGGDNDTDGGGYGFEAAAAFTPGNGITFFGGFAYETGDGDGVVLDDTESWVLNTYATYETGAWVFAAELAYGETEADAVLGGTVDTEGLNALIMANFAYSDQASVTGRISYIDYSIDPGLGDVSADQFKYTLAHGYAFTDNLLLVTEISYTDGESNDLDADWDELLGAVELLFTF